MRAGVPLWCKSNYSFLEGASHPEELIDEAQRLGFTAIGITDRDGVYGSVRAHLRAQELGMHLVTGSEVTLEDETTLVLLAQNRDGYRNLCRLITKGRLRNEKGRCRVRWTEVYEHAAGLLALWGGERSLLACRDGSVDAVVGPLREAFGDALYAMAARHKRASEPLVEALLRERAAAYGLPVVATNEVLYHMHGRKPLQDVLTCIRHGVSLSQAHTLIKPNAEHVLKSPHALAALFADDLAALERSAEVAQRCSFSLSELRYRYPSEKLPDGTTSSEWLRTLVFMGAQRRYGNEVPCDVQEQVDKELSIIERLDYAGYFLTMWEVVEFCRRQSILCQGRGSAANSAVCYCLGITAIDPVRMGLLFERFLSMERAEPPDIDLDIEHERREEVIQHVYAKYGRSHAAMVANVIRYRSRSAVRDVGKALGLTATALDRLAKLLSHWGDKTDMATLRAAGFDPELPLHAHLLELSEQILDFPRHLSIHPGGFLLGHEPVWDLVPIENGAMQDRTVIQWDKDDVEALGLFKVDLLGLGALTQLHACFDLLRTHSGIELSIASIPVLDPKTFEMICQGDTVGVFQIESRAQMSMLPRLRPKNFYDLVVEVSIVRPGPITGGMVHPYLRRRSGQEPVTYPHPCLIPVLEKTLGVPLFQEQVMRLAIVAADYSPGEADQLRRDMAAWRRSGRIESHRERLLSRMQHKGISAEFAERVFKQILGFGEYGFPESHAASFALIAYATAFLRAHHPAEFTCSLLNAQPMGFYSPATIVDDAKRHGVSVLAVDVSKSTWDCALEAAGGQGHAVRMGLCYVKGLGEVQKVCIEEAQREGEFAGLADFVRRTGLDIKSLSALAEAGAFESFGLSRRQALWQVRGLLRERESSLELAVPSRRARFVGLTPIEQIAWDYRTSSHSPRAHPLALLRGELTRQRLPEARALAALRNGAHVRFAGLVICRQRPGTASGVTFMTLEDETGFANVVFWKRVFDDYALLARTASFLGVSGKLQKQDGVVHIVAEEAWAPQMATPAEIGSRDFH